MRKKYNMEYVIFYFSGTGNTELIAEEIAKRLQAKSHSVITSYSIHYTKLYDGSSCDSRMLYGDSAYFPEGELRSLSKK